MTLRQGAFLDFDSVHPADLDLSALEAALPAWRLYPSSTPDQLGERLAGLEVVVSNKVVLGRELLAAADRLRLVCVAATGTNNVDLVAARELGIAVANVTGYATPAVTQHVFALLLALTTRLDEHRRAACDGSWSRSPYFCVLDFPFRELAGKTMGIVGYGELGRAVARVAEAFGMQVLVAQRPGGAAQADRVPLDALLRRADVVSLHVPLADNTRDLIGERELALMKPDAVLINTARGGIVDERALLAALRAGRLGGAGIDVLAVEPPPPGQPLLQAELPNLIVTPHVAWASRAARQRMLDEVAANILAYARGERRNRVA
jgi:glycerate dehydrogenase